MILFVNKVSSQLVNCTYELFNNFIPDSGALGAVTNTLQDSMAFALEQLQNVFVKIAFN